MKKIMPFLILAGMLFACGKSKSSHSTIDISEMKEIVLTNDSTVYIEDGVQDVEVIPLETSDKALVGNIGEVIMTDSNIIIYDIYQTHRVSIFNRNGKHRATIDRRGRGPQEYIGLSNVSMLHDNQLLAIHDNWGNKVLYFSLDGRFISSTPAGFWFSKMEYIDENHVVWTAYGAGKNDPGLQGYENRTDLLYFTDREFRIKGSTLPPRYKNQVIIEPYIWKWGDRVYVNRPYGDTIYRAMSNGLQAIYRIEMGEIDGVANLDPGITREELDLLREKKALFFGKFIENSRHIVISVATPPKGVTKNYLYSKQTGKAYAVECDYRMEDILLWLLRLPVNTSVKDRFVTVVQAHQVISTGYVDTKAGKLINTTMQRSELAHLTEDSNPVVILYNFKEGL